MIPRWLDGGQPDVNFPKPDFDKLARITRFERDRDFYRDYILAARRSGAPFTSELDAEARAAVDAFRKASDDIAETVNG